MTHDRVMRFVPTFDSHDQASRFAVEHALVWLGTPETALQPSTETRE